MRVALCLALLAVPAQAGGLGRPNGISARGTGMGGAWAAWVDDPTAVWFNPAALSDVEPQVHVGGELVIGPRTYTPIANGVRGDDQSATVIAPVPSVGIAGRFTNDDVPSRFTLGGGIWNTYGGQVRFPRTGAPALDATQEAVFEASAGTAVAISDRLSIGAALRLGVGVFAIEATEMPFDAELSASGVGIAMAWGLQLRPTPSLRVAAAWRSPLRITTSGTGQIRFTGVPTNEAIEHEQVWPQQATLGLGWAPGPAWRLAAQVDWTQWSQVRALVIDFPANPTLQQTFREDWEDSWTVRAGADARMSDTVALRAGAYMDTAAVPDRTIERQYIDSLKFGVATGATVTRAAWRFDAAVDLVLPNTREVPDNTVETTGFPADRNKAPGEYRGLLLTFELAAAYRF